MYTTMDYDFFEQSYYHSQSGHEGEKFSDDLSWLIYLVKIDQEPKEQVDESTDVVSEDIVSPLLTTPVLTNEHPVPKEVIFKPQPVIDNNIDPVAIVDEPSRFELPPKSTRGIPSRRYAPEFVIQRSRYPVTRENNKVLSQIAVAFNTSLYSSTVPKMLKRLFRIRTGKKQWKKKSLLLIKTKHGRSVSCQRERKQSDVDGCIPLNIWLIVLLRGIRPD